MNTNIMQRSSTSRKDPSRLESRYKFSTTLVPHHQAYSKKTDQKLVDHVVPVTIKKRNQQEIPARNSATGTSTPVGLKPRQSIEETAASLSLRLFKHIDMNSNATGDEERKRTCNNAKKNVRNSQKENVPSNQNISLSSSDFTVYKFEESDVSEEADQEAALCTTAAAATTATAGTTTTFLPPAPVNIEGRVYNWNGHPRIAAPPPLNTGYSFLNHGRARNQSMYEESYDPPHKDFNIGHTYLNHFYTDQATVNESWNSSREDESLDTTSKSQSRNEWYQYEKYKNEQTQRSVPTVPSTTAGRLPEEEDDDDSKISYNSHHVLLEKKEHAQAVGGVAYDISPFDAAGATEHNEEDDADGNENDGKSTCTNQSWISDDISQIRSTCTRTSSQITIDHRRYV